MFDVSVDVKFCLSIFIYYSCVQEDNTMIHFHSSVKRIFGKIHGLSGMLKMSLENWLNKRSFVVVCSLRPNILFGVFSRFKIFSAIEIVLF